MFNVVSERTKRLLKDSFRPGVGMETLRKYVQFKKDHDPDDLADDDEIFARRPSYRNGKQKVDRSSEILEACERESIRIVSPFDEPEAYPPQLFRIPEFPPLLYLRGSLLPLSKAGFAAVVGTREASHLGIKWATRISEVFVDADYCVVSGLALGIDTAAHEGALHSGTSGATIAIMAHGLDRITPTSNTKLARRILDNDGALISEHAPGTPPRRAEYVRRNRIQSGLSFCSILVESDEVGGAIHEARFTHKQERKLYYIAPDSNERGYSEFKIGGANRLKAEFNAQPIRNVAELQEVISKGLAETVPAEQPKLDSVREPTLL